MTEALKEMRAIDVDACLQAIRDPDNFGIYATSSRFKTNFVFGHPKSLTQAKVDSIISQIRNNKSGE